MKKIFFIFIALVCFVNTNAQTQSDSIKETYNKIHDLENRISLQDTRINKLIQQVDEVTKQNLALKKNLKLSPTIATAKAGDIMEYRIIEVTGDTATNEVHIVIVADNLKEVEKIIKYYTMRVIDDLGRGYNDIGKRRLMIEGVTRDVIMENIRHYPNAPYTMDLYLYDYNPESLYVKMIDITVIDERDDYSVRFENLPIKWNN